MQVLFRAVAEARRIMIIGADEILTQTHNIAKIGKMERNGKNRIRIPKITLHNEREYKLKWRQWKGIGVVESISNFVCFKWLCTYYARAVKKYINWHIFPQYDMKLCTKRKSPKSYYILQPIRLEVPWYVNNGIDNGFYLVSTKATWIECQLS